MTNPYLAELEQLRKRVAVLENVVVQNARFLLGCPADYQITTCDRQNCYSKDNRDCWTAALAQAEGGEPDGE